MTKKINNLFLLMFHSHNKSLKQQNLHFWRSCVWIELVCDDDVTRRWHSWSARGGVGPPTCPRCPPSPWTLGIMLLRWQMLGRMGSILMPWGSVFDSGIQCQRCPETQPLNYQKMIRNIWWTRNISMLVKL